MKIKGTAVSTISLVFVLIGLGFGLFKSRLCSRVCENCTSSQLDPCYFLFLFVGIIFVVCGASLFKDFKELGKIKGSVKK